MLVRLPCSRARRAWSSSGSVASASIVRSRNIDTGTARPSGTSVASANRSARPAAAPRRLPNTPLDAHGDLVAMQPCPRCADGAGVSLQRIVRVAAELEGTFEQARRLLPRELPVGNLGGSLAPPRRGVPLAEHRCSIPMSGELGRLRVTPSVVGFDRVRDRAMKHRQLRGPNVDSTRHGQACGRT